MLDADWSDKAILQADWLISCVGIDNTVGQGYFLLDLLNSKLMCIRRISVNYSKVL